MNISKTIAAIMLLSAASMINARDFGAGFGVGAVTGLATGLLTSKIAENSRPTTVYYVEDPYNRYERDRLEMERQNLIEQRRLERARMAQPKKIIHVKKTSIINNQQERELALKEKEIELALTREKKELLIQENRKKELALKEKQIGFKLAQK